MRRGGIVEKVRFDADTELRSAICIYRIADHRAATVTEPAHLRLGGRPALEEASRVKRAVSYLADSTCSGVAREANRSGDTKSGDR